MNSNEIKADVNEMLKHLQQMGVNTGNLAPVEKGTVFRKAVTQGTQMDHQKEIKVEGGIPPVFPMSYQGTEVKEELDPKRGWEEAFAEGISGTYDPELNKLALQEVAESRGMSVEELISSDVGKKEISQKVKPLGESVEQNNAMDVDTMLQQKQKELEAQLLQLKQQQSQLKQQQFVAPPVNLNSAPKASSVKAKLHSTNQDILHPKAKNPVLSKIRQKLSIESIKPESVTVQGLTFELLPPPGSLQPWILQKLSNIAEVFGGDEVIMQNTLKNLTFAASIVRIDGVPAAEALELVEQDSIKDIHTQSPELRELVAQALWEMSTGTSTIGLPSIHPEVVSKVFTSYSKSFKEGMFESSIDPQEHRYVCDVPGCQEVVDRIPKDTPYFCSEHGTPLSDLGPLTELKSSPLA